MPTDKLRIIVQKYGGSSVADPDKIKLVAKQIANSAKQGFSIVVVVSAMGKTTDALISLASSISQKPHRREMDMLLSTGERISMALLAMALQELGIDAISFTGSQSGIITNDRHSGARIIEVRPIRIEDELLNGKVVIVAGFQGMSYKREITTLGRGGSDTTAVALAAALNAESCEIYSDIDGVYSSDPKTIPDAKHLPTLSYEHMQELAEHGAKVLNAEAIRWAKQAGITIHARKTGTLEEKETIVTSLPAENPLANDPILSVTFFEKTYVLKCRPAKEALSLLANARVALKHCRIDFSENDSTLHATFLKDDLPDFQELFSQLKLSCLSFEYCEDIGFLCLLLPSSSDNSALLQQVDFLLQKYSFSPKLYDLSALRLCIWLPSKEVTTAASLLHKHFISS